MDEIKAESVDIQEYLAVLKKNKWLILACVVAALFGTVIYNETQTPIYAARVRLEVKSTPRALLTEYSYYSDWWTKERDLNTHFEILKSANIMERVCRKARLQEVLARDQAPQSGLKKFFAGLVSPAGPDPGQSPASSKGDPGDKADPLAASLVKALTIEPVKDTNLADIQVEHSNPMVAYLTANTIAEVYEDFILETRFAEIRNMMNIYTDQMVTLKKTLRESEERYLDFIQKTGISSLQDKKEITLEGLSDLKLSYTDTRIKRAELESDLKALETVASGDLDRILQAPLLDQNGALNQLKQDILATQLQLLELQKKYRPQHPEVVKKESLLQTLKQKFREQLDTYLQGKRAELESLQVKERELARAIQEHESRAIQDSSVSLQYKRLKDELESNKALYETLLNKVKELDITKSSRDSSIQVVQQAALPQGPVRPRKGLNLILGLLLGVLGGIGLAFGLEYVDNTFKNPSQIKSILKVPTLAMIEKLPAKGRDWQLPAIESAKELPATFTEAFRFLKTNLALTTVNHRHATFLVTSTGAGEGKTTVAAQLAAAFAREGRETLLVDLDLRKPRIHQMFGISNGRGFTSLMLDPFSFIPLSGDLSEFPITNILYLLIKSEKSGVLQVRAETGEYRVSLVGGKIAQVDSSRREETDRLGQLLVRKGGLPADALPAAIAEASRRGERLGEYLFSTGRIPLPPLVEVLLHQLTATFSQLIQVNAGAYAFEETEDLFYHPEILARLDSEAKFMELFDARLGRLGDAPERFAISPTAIERLFVLPAGPRPPDPDDVLTSARVSTVLHLLRRHFQTIVVDSPPAALVSDSNTLSPQVDGIIYVVRYGSFPRKLIQNTLERIRANGGRVIGVAMNAVNLRRESYLDDHYYYAEYYRRGPDA